jgi:UDP-glucose 4-epimerase
VKKVIITGGAGFIGSRLANTLFEDRVDVRVIDNLSYGKRSNLNPKIPVYVMDVCDYDMISPIFEGVDTVFHLAAVVSVQYSIENPIETNRTNVLGTYNTLMAAKDNGVKKIVYSSSSAVYGDCSEWHGSNECDSLRPISPYGFQKMIAENYCEFFSEFYKMDVSILRYFNVYGPNQNDEGPYAGVISKFIKNKKKRRPLEITGDGMQSRDFVHVDDVVRANIYVANKEKRELTPGTINIGSGHDISINELATIVGGKVIHVPEREEPKRSLADIGRAVSWLDWEPRIKLEDGIKALLSE